MSDCRVQGAFAFRCSPAEAALIEEGFQLSDDLIAGLAACEPSVEFRAHFPLETKDDIFSSSRGIFCDAENPSFGADLRVAGGGDAPDACEVMISSITDLQPDPISELIHRCCQPALARHSLSFECCVTTTPAEIGGFHGGWCTIFADRIVLETTTAALDYCIATNMGRRTSP